MPSFRRPSLILHATAQYVAEPMLRLEAEKQMPDSTVCGVRSCCPMRFPIRCDKLLKTRRTTPLKLDSSAVAENVLHQPRRRLQRLYAGLGLYDTQSSRLSSRSSPSRCHCRSSASTSIDFIFGSRSSCESQLENAYSNVR